MTIYLVRHATAGIRQHGDPLDHERQLDEYGLAQAEMLAAALADVPLDRIMTSAATRCSQTVAPVADRRGIEIEISPPLFEGAPPADSIGLLRSLVGQHVVLCSHGDIIPDLLRRLEVGGTRLDGRGCAKGSVWTLDNSTERIESGFYRDTTPDVPDA